MSLLGLVLPIRVYVGGHANLVKRNFRGCFGTLKRYVKFLPLLILRFKIGTIKNRSEICISLISIFLGFLQSMTTIKYHSKFPLSNFCICFLQNIYLIKHLSDISFSLFLFVLFFCKTFQTHILHYLTRLSYVETFLYLTPSP